MQEHKDLAKFLLENSSLKGAETSDISHLAGDASGRRYIRVKLSKSKQASVLLMLLNSQKGPIAGGNNYNSQDDSFYEVDQLFADYGINVPKIFIDARDQRAFLVEDLGDLQLCKLSLEPDSKAIETLNDQMGEDFLFLLYQKALKQLLKIQNIDNTKHQVFQRLMSFEQYREEAQRLITFYLEPKGLKKSEIKSIAKCLDNLCESVASHKKVLMHRDFMPWNLIVKDQEVYVIDFQDTLIGSENYDLVALLHDRDADFKAGESFCKRIISEFLQLKAIKNIELFEKSYNEILMQRHLRLAGQFNMLSQKTGNPIYKNWGPGCFIRSTWALLNCDYMQDTLDILYKHVGEVRESASAPWKLF